MRSALKWLLWAMLLAAGALWWLSRPLALTAADLPAYAADPANGERLFHAGGCAACHGDDLAGGLELETEFGTFRVPNISPDPETGIGGWSSLDFANAMLRGVSPGGSHYYPAFPYTSYTRMPPRDLADLKAYLDTQPAVSSEVGPHKLHFPWNIRRGIGLWKRRYLDPAPVLEIDPGDESLARGHYLVEAVGHCGECHTPRDRFGGTDRSRWLAGAANPDGEGRVPNITPHEDGLGGWSEKEIRRYLKTGFTPDFDMVGGSMVHVQENLALLPDEDRAAIVRYLKAVPALPKSP